MATWRSDLYIAYNVPYRACCVRCMTSSCSEAAFVSVHTKTTIRRRQERVKKKPSLRTVLKNLRFWCPKVPLKCGQKAKTWKKFFLLKNIRIRADAGPYYPYFTIKLSSLDALNRVDIIYNLSFNYQCWNNHLSCGTTSNWARLSLTHSQELKAIAAKV